jgi:aminodeoxyfutalosine deaminase
LPIAYCQLPIAQCLLPIAHCPLPIAYCPSPIAHCLLPIYPVLCIINQVGKNNSLSYYMSYLKFKADQLFTGSELLKSDQVLITNPDGEIVSVVNEIEAGDDFRSFKGILSPGFINTHCHLELSHLKHLIPEKTGLVDFVYKVITQRHFPEEVILDAIEKAEDEMLAGGIVAAGDICNNLLTLPQKLKRRIMYYNFIEASGWLPDIAPVRFSTSKRHFDEFSKNFPNTSIAPHAPYSVSAKLWELITPFFENKVTSIHNQETFYEDEFFLNGTGPLTRMFQLMNIDNTFHTASNKSSLQTVFPHLSGAASVILVHNTFTNESDINQVKPDKKTDQIISFCLCVNANLYIENSLPPIDLFIQNECAIVLGTDSLASNHELSLLCEMKTIQKNFPAIPLKNILSWATINGARALKIEKNFGSFEKAKKPGVVLIQNLEGENLLPCSTCRRIL